MKPDANLAALRKSPAAPPTFYKAGFSSIPRFRGNAGQTKTPGRDSFPQPARDHWATFPRFENL